MAGKPSSTVRQATVVAFVDNVVFVAAFVAVVNRHLTPDHTSSVSHRSGESIGSLTSQCARQRGHRLMAKSRKLPGLTGGTSPSMSWCSSA